MSQQFDHDTIILGSFNSSMQLSLETKRYLLNKGINALDFETFINLSTKDQATLNELERKTNLQFIKELDSKSISEAGKIYDSATKDLYSQHGLDGLTREQLALASREVLDLIAQKEGISVQELLQKKAAEMDSMKEKSIFADEYNMRKMLP